MGQPHCHHLVLKVLAWIRLAPSFQWALVIDDPFTSRLCQYSLKEKADISGFWSGVPETFAQLKSDLNNHNFLTDLGNFAVDDPS